MSRNPRLEVLNALPLVGLAGSMTFLALAVTPEAAEPVSPTADARGTLDAPPTNATRPLRSGGANQIPAHGAPIVLEINKGTLIRLTAPAATVFIANPDVEPFDAAQNVSRTDCQS